MLLFFAIIFICIIFILLFSEIKLIVNNLKITKNNIEFKVDYNLKLGLYFLGKIKLIGIKINNEKMQKLLKNNSTKNKLQIIKTQNKNINNKQNFVKILELLKIDKLNLNLYIDTKNVLLTTYLVAIISTIIPNILRKKLKKFKKQNYNFQIYPIYKNESFLYMNLNSIISVKIVHIINMLKRGGNRYERASNRRFNVNCYGKH